MYPTTRKMRKNKYGNKKVVIDGIEFDSGKEGNRYVELKMLQKAHVIYDLQVHVKFELQPKFRDKYGHVVQPITYEADFVYWRDGERIIEDVKSPATKKDEKYRMKKKMMAYRGNYITEV